MRPLHLFACALLSAPAWGLAPLEATAGDDPSKISNTRLLSAAPVHVGGATVFEDQDELRAVGHDWKATFLADGVRFTPALGNLAPRNMPLELGLVELRQGDVRLAAPESRPLSHDKRSAHYDLGHGRVERFEVGDEGLSLSIDFPQPLAAGGELVARYRVDTELELQAADADGLTYASPYGGVQVSGVFGIDADGWRVAGELRPHGEFLDLVLPAEFVERASWPIELDPTLSPYSNFGAGSQPSVCFDDWTDTFLVAWQSGFSAIDSDILARRIDKNGVQQGALIVLESASGTLAANPAVAVDHDEQLWVVAWSTSSGLFAPSQIELRGVVTISGTPLSTTQLPPSAQSQQLPSLCSGNAVGSQDPILCWREAGAGVRVSRLVNGFGTINPTPPVSVTDDPTADAPVISKTTRSTGRVLITWEADDENGDEAIYARAFEPGLDGSTPTTLIYAGAGNHVGNPSCDGNGRRWRVVFELDDPGFFQLIRFAHVEWAPDGTLHSESNSNLGANSDGYHPDIALTGDEYGLIFNDTGSGGSELNFVRTSIPKFGSTSFDDFTWPISTVLTGGEIAFPFAANATHQPGNNVGCAVWVHSDGTIFAGNAELYPSIEVIEPGCIGTESAFCSAPRAGSTLRCLLDTDIPSMPVVYLLGFNTSLLPCGSCTILPDTSGGGILQLYVTDSLGNVNVALNVPAGSEFLGFEAFNQWLPAVPNPPCPDFGLGASKVLRLEVFSD